MTSSDSVRNPRIASYWERVEFLMDPASSQEDVQWIMDNEGEDDFRKALASRPDATGKQLAWSADHHGFEARKLVVGHPNVLTETLRKIRDETEAEVAFSTLPAHGASPMQSHHAWVIEKAAELMKAAADKLAERGEEL